jgi:molybdopterin-guanine dinucleotide biosynthesis protein B
MKSTLPVLGFAAFSGTGKTTLLRRLIPLLSQQGLRVGIIKHAHHDFDIDIPGKDSYELRKAGACQVLVASDQRWALITETRVAGDPDLDTLLSRIDPATSDLVLVEGFRHLPFPRIELHRQALGHPLLHPYDPTIIALACDYSLDACTLPVLDINDADVIADFILAWLDSTAASSLSRRERVSDITGQ